MAGRLLGRYARLLCRVSSQATATTAARLPPPVVGASAVQKAQGWHWVTERSMCEGRTIPQEDSSEEVPTSSPLNVLIDKAVKPESVLEAWKLLGGNGQQAATALLKWSLLMFRLNGNFKKTPSELETDPRLKDLMQTLSKEVNSVWNGSLIAALRTLWRMQIPDNNPVLNSVQTEILWRMRRLSYKHLSFLADWGANRKNQQDLAIVHAALKQLELRWTEINEAKTICTLLASGKRMSPSLLGKLEDKALELGDKFSAEEIRRICVSLATQNHRSVPLFRALSYHLLQRPSAELTTPLIMDIAFAYGKLGFSQIQLFQRMASELLPRVPGLSSTDVTRCAKSFGFLKWLHIPVFEAFAQHYSKKSETYSVPQLCSLLLTFARLNFQPSKGEEFYPKVHAVLEDSLSDLGPFLQTDVVWSLCVLQQAKPQYIIPLLQESHISKLSDGPTSRTEGYHQKLLHIATTLLLEHPGSLDSSSSLKDLLVWTRSSPASNLQSTLGEALQTLVEGRPEALLTGIDTVYGWTIDGELVVDCDNKPIDMSELNAPHLRSEGGDQDLPAGARRIAFIALEFQNYCSKSKDLLGRFVMMKRHLQLAGFITVEVPYYEWLELKAERQKLAYLKDKIGKAVAEDMAK
ncbi:FAST kinase domain-containing protein 4 [Halichoeres trimaculatus]|uniref:FAST kinase domain-containing protein 4 n=1 Tax=Halichoeres trimaculatus TaxID=147232 RepID=UPI003D9E6EB8